MTQAEPLKQAIEALESCSFTQRESSSGPVNEFWFDKGKVDAAIAALRAADKAIDRFADGMAAITRGPT
jgi:hypothetical protein